MTAQSELSVTCPAVTLSCAILEYRQQAQGFPITAENDPVQTYADSFSVFSFGRDRSAALPPVVAKIQLDSISGGPYAARSFQRKLKIMRRPKGIKTRKAVAKRFKITARGKVMRSKAGRRHLLQTKSAKRRRGLGKSAVVDPTDTYRITQNLPFSH